MSEKNATSEVTPVSGRDRDLYQVDPRHPKEMGEKRAATIRDTEEMATYAEVSAATGEHPAVLEHQEANADVKKMLIDEFQPGYLAILNDSSLSEEVRRAQLIQYNAEVQEALERLVGVTGLTREDITAAQQIWKELTPELQGGRDRSVDESFRQELGKGLRKALETEAEEDEPVAV